MNLFKNTKTQIPNPKENSKPPFSKYSLKFGNRIFTWILLFVVWIFIPSAMAAQYDIRQMTPEIQTALSHRKSRYESLQALKASGSLGENNSGYVSVLEADPSAQSAAATENSDRQIIYQAIVDQNRLGAGGMALVEKAFADVQREKARPGESIQLPSGEWAKK